MNNLKKIELKLRSGHNRLNKHLHRLHLNPDSSCSYCGAEEEDVLYLLIYCTKIPGLAEFDEARQAIDVSSRVERDKFLFSQADEIRDVRHALLNLCLKCQITI